MAQSSSIEWTDATWNPVTGCTKISPGCKNCYAERMAKRLQAMRQPRYRNGFKLTVQPDLIEQPLRWTEPRMIFVNSMSDLFHEDIPFEYLNRVFDVMARAHWHVFQVLTKRSDRLAEVASRLHWPSNVWMGVSVESQQYTNRIHHLRKVPSALRFLSIEPLLGPITTLPLDRIDWVIVGGESGPKARPLNIEWVRNIRDRCIDARVPFFFKQWGGTRKTLSGRVLDGQTWDEMPPSSDLTNASSGGREANLV
jgi:protein gp37